MDVSGEQRKKRKDRLRRARTMWEIYMEFEKRTTESVRKVYCEVRKARKARGPTFHFIICNCMTRRLSSPRRTKGEKGDYRLTPAPRPFRGAQLGSFKLYATSLKRGSLGRSLDSVGEYIHEAPHCWLDLQVDPNFDRLVINPTDRLYTLELGNWIKFPQ